MGHTSESTPELAASAERKSNPTTAEAGGNNQIQVIDLIVVFARRRTLMLTIIVTFLLTGLVLSLMLSETYVAEAKVVRESQSEMPAIGALGGGIAALQGMGFNLGGAMTSGLTSQAYASVLKSREVRLAIARDTFYFPDAGKRMTMIEHAQRPPGWVGHVLDYTIYLPKTLLAPSETDSIRVGGNGPTIAVPDLEVVLERVGQTISSRTDQQSGLMTISASTGSPTMSAEVNRSAIRHLTERVREIRTRRTRERLAFVEERFAEVRSELDEAEERLASFLESNQNPTTAKLRFQRDRLRRQVSFKEQLYTELQGQLTQVRLELQRSQPVVTVVEEPVPPVEPSSPNHLLNIIISLVLGLIVAVAVAIIASFLAPDDDQDDEYQRKLDTIRDAFLSEKIASKFRSVTKRFH